MIMKTTLYSIYTGRAAERSGAVCNDLMVHNFVESYLRVDGVFLLRLIAHNTSGITATEVTKEMWDLWYDEHYAQKTVENCDDSITEIKRRIE